MPLSTRTALLSSLLLTLAAQLVVTDEVPPKVAGVSVSKAVKDGSPSLRVTWTAVQNVTTLSEYQAEYRHNGESNWGHRVSAQPYSTSILLPALLPGTEYNVRMRAVSAAGEGEWSDVLTETTFNTPLRVTGVSLSKEVLMRKPSLNVTWTALPLSLVSFYEIQHRIKDTSWEHQGSGQPYSQTYVLPNLVPGTEYNVRVRAVSAAREGEWSEVHTETTYNIPSKVMNVSVTKSVEDGNFTLNVSWTTPQSELPITEYKVEYEDASEVMNVILSGSPPANSTLLTGLDAGVEYIVRVRALSEIGAGAWSEELVVSPTDKDDRLCNRFGKCSQPSANETTTTQPIETTTTPVLAAPPLTAIVGAIIAVGVVLLVLLILGAVSLVVYLLRRQKRTKREVIDGAARAPVCVSNAVPTSLHYYDTPERFEMTTQKASIGSLPEARAKDHEYDNISTSLHIYTELQSSYDQEQSLYWKPTTSVHGFKAQKNQSAKDSFELNPASITLQESLGEGEFGTVHKGVWASSPQGLLQVAVKTLHSQEKDNKYKLLKEAAILWQFNHPNVVRLYGVIDEPGKVMLIMECLSGGDLRNHLLICRSTPACKKLALKLLKFCQEIADAMYYLSKRGFIHRDLAARNILLSEQYIAKIADFGIFHDMDEDYYYNSRGGMIPVKWTAPEVILYQTYTTKSDVWSYGMVMYEIWSLGHQPFEEFDINSVLRAMETGYCQPPPPGCPRNIYKLMVDCWNPEHNTRPTFEDITLDLARDPVVLLSWSQQDKATSSKSAILGAPLEEGRHLYPDLQNKY